MQSGISQDIKTIPLEKPYAIPAMGTSGVREKQEWYNQDQLLQQFIQGIADHFKSLDDKFLSERDRKIIIGGDPRLGNKERIYIAAEILAANGFKVEVALDNVASTPAMSHAIRHQKAVAGIILTASHNPFTDVGIKVNDHTGAPALEDIVKGVHQKQNQVKSYNTVDFETARSKGLIKDIDTVGLYADLMDKIFDFADMRKDLEAWEKKFKKPFSMVLDGMGGAAGPFIQKVFVERLGLVRDKNIELLRCNPDPYLGGPNDPKHPAHPEPDFGFIAELLKKNATGLYDLVSAYDADGDRRLDGGNKFWIESADQMALFAKYADLIGIQHLFGTTGEIVFARSTVTAPTIDVMKNFLEKKYAALGYKIRILQTATGFKYIAEYGNFGAEESNGMGNPWIREKDGLFSTLLLMKIMLKEQKHPRELMEEIWKEFGRNYFTRGEISKDPQNKPGTDEYKVEVAALKNEKENLTKMIESAIANKALIGKKFGEYALEGAEVEAYIDPAGKLRDPKAAYSFKFSNGISFKTRFSGTATGGYTLRIYLFAYNKKFDIPKTQITQPIKDTIREFFINGIGFGSNEPKAYTDANQPDIYLEERSENLQLTQQGF